MRKVSKEELAEIVRKHRLWRRGEPGGERADLSWTDLSGVDLTRAYLVRAYLTGADLTSANLQGTDLTGADLTGINICGAIGNGEEIKSYQGLRWRWQVVWTKAQLAIGYEQHSLEEWENFTDEEMERMGAEGDDSLGFWRKHKDFILSLVREELK